MANNKTKSIEDVKSFARKVYRRKLFQWITNKTILTLAILLAIYLFWLIYSKVFFFTHVEWKIFPITLLLSLAPFFFGKPTLSETIEFLEKEIKELKSRLYLVTEPYPAILDSKAYRKRIWHGESCT